MAKNNVVDFPGPSTLPEDPARTLQRAAEAGLQQVLVIGWDNEGQFWACASHPSGPDALWLLESCKQALLDVGNG